MRNRFLALLCLFLGLLAGALLAYFSLDSTFAWFDGGQRRNGNWRYNPVMDLSRTGFQRARIAKIGLFALRESEVLYYLANTDDKGNPLNADYDYEVIGHNLESRYWSLTLYDGDHFLIPNPARRYSYNLENVIYEDSTRRKFRLVISRNARELNWLPAGDGKNMSLILRLYNPEKQVYENMDKVPLPIIRRIGNSEL